MKFSLIARTILSAVEVFSDQKEKLSLIMKVKKYPQSHLVITSDSGKKIVIDPGYLTFQQGFKISDCQGADVYLITHQHADHLGPETIKEVVGNSPVYGNSDVVGKLVEVGVEAKEVRDRETFEVAGVKITPVDLPHFSIGKEVPPNTGFIIDSVFFHAGDGFELEGVQVDNAALPIGHPALTNEGVMEFAKSLGCKLLIPIHYDAYPGDPEELKKLVEPLGIEVRPLANGEETEI